jgi:HD-like signal output (HDOD) protein
MVADYRERTTWSWLPDAGSAVTQTPVDERQSAFEFVQSLAAELSRGRVDLPTSPDVARQLQEALDADNLSNTFVTRVIGADGGLAANVFALANGKANARGARPLTDLKLAVTRVGSDNVRSAALPYVLEKIRSAQAHAHLGEDLARLWDRSTLVAAISRVLAERTYAAPPDVALLAGLLHNVGAVYLLSRADKHLALFRNPVTRDVLMHDWQAPIGKAIAQNWGLPDAIADAIGDQEQLDRHDAGPRDLTDVLCVGVRSASFFEQPEELEIALGSLPLFRRLGLDRSALRGVMVEAARHTTSLRAALALDR